jgi:VWFA-related protein
VRRLNPIPYAITDYGKNSGSPMTEYMALTIERKDDSNVFDFFVRDCQKWAPPGVTKTDRASMRRHCEIEVQNRARQILVQAGNVTAATYYSLETLLQSAQRMPGSKLAFFVSDGFLADTGPRGPTASNQLERITDEARRGGVVIYTVDARGLVSGALDATGSVPMDPDGRLENAKTRQITAAQDALDNLAANTGGRALRNQNTFDNFVSDALAETSRYYLIAWRPEANESKTELLKQIQLSIVGHPELTVRSSRGYVSNTSRASIDNAPISEKKPETALKEALNDFYPKADLPVQLSVIYLDTPDNGLVLTSSVQAPAELLSYGEQNNEPAQLSIAGVVLNDQGKPAASFKTSLKVNPSTSSKVIYNQPSPLKPGIYQVRVAARDDRSGTIGSAMQWLMIPDLSQRQLALSSLIVGLESVGHNVERVQWSIDRKFAPNSQLRFMTFIYNGGADLVALVNVYRDGRAVVSMPAKKVVRNNTSDPNRIPFNSEINLTGLPPGRYILEVRVEDGTTHATAIQQTSFYIE